ncbi:HAMP domain-containing sensor histidine kinase [Paenibacillus roseipurpureus]|uniref:Signal transduction histidine-protein kinase ArlS n=1 Tax=Paenibacillus roseopurpureus TaxID=2918901 RepID=A0AA96LL57_9BACL|nr:HAMP domain-containing histidine kinase [Paenibacillus sp. MBLB1832]WNR43111.1 HAMP domain-containing histidine kinase [Paenibacillus sp. MBLB1832]
MKIKTKAFLLSFGLLASILIPLFFVIYYFYSQYEIEEEIESLQQTANEIISHNSSMDLLQMENNPLLNAYLPNHTLIRTIDPSSAVRNQVSNSNEFAAFPPQFMNTPQAYLDRFQDEAIIIVRSPITSGTEIVGTLEIISEPRELEQSLYHLIMITCLVALGAIFISISGSLLLARLLFSPLSRMITIMKEIETSMEIRKLPMNRKSKDELYHLADTFNHMMERIQMSMRKQRQFISDASHEFKTSLTIIEGYTSLLQRWGYEKIDLCTEAIAAVHAESIRMKHITYQLLELAELDHESKLSLSVFDLVSLCRETIQLLQPLSTKEIRLFTPSPILEIEADRLQIHQLLLIPLDNALKYAKQRIDVHLESHPSHLYIRILDDGIGIPSDELPFIFERFYRVDRSRSRQTGGSGLGLAIAKSIVELHQGTIQMKSERNQGTEVIIALPRKKTFNSSKN